MRLNSSRTFITVALVVGLALALLVAVAFSISAAAMILTSDWNSASAGSILDVLGIAVNLFLTPVAVIALLCISIRDLISQTPRHLATAAIAVTAGVLLANSWLFHAFPSMAMLFSIAAFSLAVFRVWALRRQ